MYNAILSTEEVIEKDEVDIVCTGEGEEVLKELLDKSLDCKNIKGIWYKKNGEIEREPLITDNVEYFIGKSWLIGDANHEFMQRYFLSHLEIVHIDKLPQMINKFTRLQIATSSKVLKGRKLEALQTINQ